MKRLLGVLGICTLVPAPGCVQSPGASTVGSSPVEALRGEPSRPVREFHFECSTTLAGLPASAKELRIWLPIPQTDENQTISNLRIESPLAHRETRESTYGNRIAYFECVGTCPERVPIKVSFDVHRVETSEGNGLMQAGQRERLLAGDRLAPTTGEAQARAVQAAPPTGDNTAKARAIYDRVLSDVEYSKTVPGWGHGDLSYVCRVGKGNCSDFHALFISMARSQQIPALFEIGFPLPRDKKEGTIAGYHCWAWYEDSSGVWRPVDASEADKDPARKEFFFGSLCCNRVALSRGRDIVLEPRQSGEPLNFFVYPYVEVDGKPLESGIEKAFSFKELSVTSS